MRSVNLIILFSAVFIFFLGLFLFFPKQVQAATATWTNGGGDGLWTTCGNWSGGTGTNGCPGTSDVATFNSASTANSTIPAGSVISVAGVSIDITYSGSITQTTTATITLGASGWSQTGGTFTGGSGSITINPGSSYFTYSLTGGTFTSTSGNFLLMGGAAGSVFTINGGTFNHNTGTVIFAKGGNANAATITGSATFYKLSFGNNTFNDSYNLAAGTTLTVNNTLTFNVNNSGSVNGPGNIIALGDITTLNNMGVNGTAVITVRGTTDQTITGGVIDYPAIPSLTINKTSGNLILVNNIRMGNTLTYIAGNVITTGSTLLLAPPCSTSTVAGSITLYNVLIQNNSSNCGSSVTFTSGTVMTVAGTLTMQRNGTSGLNINGPGTIVAQGNVIADTGSTITGNTSLTMSGTNNQNLTQISNFPTGTFTINKSSGIVTLGSDINLSGLNQALLFSSGTLNMSTYSLATNGVFTIGGTLIQSSGNVQAGTFVISKSGIWKNTSSGGMVVGSGGVTNNGSMNFGSLTNCGNQSTIAITSSSPGSARTWAGIGTYAFYNLSVTDQNENPWKGKTVAFSSTTSNSNFLINSSCPTPPTLNWHLDDGQGSTAFDASPNKNNGIISNATWVNEDQCVYGKCLSFSGSSSAKVTAGSSLTNVQTISFWVKPKTTTESIMDLDEGTHTITISSGILTANGFSGTPTYYVNGKSTRTIIAGNWQHVEITIGSGSAINASSIKAGFDNTNYFNGFLDEIKFYNYIRSSSQAKADYNSVGSISGTSVSLGSGNSVYLSQGLVGYWKMDESSWNGTPGEVKDASGNGNNGTAACTGTGCTLPTLAAGKFGNSGYFSYSGSTYNYGKVDTGSIDFGDRTQVTISAWTYESSRPSWWFNYVGQYLSCNGSVTEGGLANGYMGTGFKLPMSDGKCYAAAGSAPPLNGWHFMTGTYDGKYVRYFLDGVLKASTAATGTHKLNQNYQTNIYFGEGDSSHHFIGNVDEVRIYNRALSPAEVRQLYNFAPGPVAYYKFDEGKNGTCGSGKDVCDTSGNANDGSWNGTGTNHWTTGKYGKAGGFNGSNDYVSGSNAIVLNNMTVEAWVKTKINNYSVGGTIVEGQYNNGGPFYFSINGSNPMIWYHTTSVTSFGGSTSVSDGLWHHVAFTFDGTTGIIYTDGKHDGQSTAISGNLASMPSAPLIGKEAGNRWYFNGSLDDVKIYNYARTPDQIMEDMNARTDSGVSLQGVTSFGKGPVGYWKMDEGYGTTAHDSSGNGKDGTINGASWSQNGKFGKALKFRNAASDRVVTPLASNLTNNMAMSAWVNWQGGTGGIQDILFNGSYDNGTGWAVEVNSADSNHLAILCHNVDTATSTVTLPTNSWQHLVVQKNNGTWEMYINGVKKTLGGGTTCNPNTPTIETVIGNYNSAGPTGSFNGLIDEVKIYNYALTSDEVLTEYNHGSALILGALGSNSSYSPNSSAQQYCVPGSSDPCAAPVAEWNFEEGKNGTCTGGKDVCDTSGNGNDGTWSGTGTNHWTTGKFGKAGLFNGSNDWVSAPNSTSIQNLPNSDFTFEMWMNVPNWNQKEYFSKGAWNYGWNISGEYGLPEFWIVFPTATATASPATAPSVNMWHHYAWVFSTATQSFVLYVDGVRQALSIYSQNGSGTYAGDSSYNLVAGARSADKAIPMSGSIDDVKIYNYARTPAQIAWDYNRGEPVAWYKFNECTGTNIHDSSGNNLTGTLATGSLTAGTCSDGTNTTIWNKGATGKYGASLYLDGSNDQVNFSSGPDISGSQGTISFWIDPSDLSGDSEQGVYGNSAGSYMFQKSWASTGFSFWIDNYSVDLNAGDIPQGAWTHVTLTWDDVAMVRNIYLNGALKVHNTSWFDTPAATLAFIGNRDSGGKRFKGQVDDFRIYNYVLTSTQIKALYNNNAAVRFGP